MPCIFCIVKAGASLEVILVVGLDLEFGVDHVFFVAIDDFGREEDDDFGFFGALVHIPKGCAKERNLPKYREAFLGVGSFFLNKAANQDGHAIFHADGGLCLRSVDNRNLIVGPCGDELRGTGHFRLDLHGDIAVIMNGGCHFKFDPYINEIDRLRSRGGTGRRCCGGAGHIGLGRSNENPCFFIIDGRDAGIGQNPDPAHAV